MTKQNHYGSGDNIERDKIVNYLVINKIKERDQKQQQLLNHVKSEVKNRLKSLLHNRISIILDKEEDPLNLRYRWDEDRTVHTIKAEKIPSGTTIDRIYDREGVDGKLLILGKPGSGKTTTLLQLAEILIKRCEQNIKHPIPILFNLSSWTDQNQSIHDWIINSLKANPYGIKRELSQEWLEKGEILPLLDGLDELSSLQQRPCVKKLNEYLESKRLGLPLVICSRLQEFKNSQIPLSLNACIILQELTEKQIKDYITKTEGIVLWEEIKKDSDLLELTRIPFFLSIIVITCEEISFIKWQKLPSDLARKEYLFETYINKMFARQHKTKIYTEKKAKKWLGWLAVQLTNENKTEFFIESIQPYWLIFQHEKLIYALICGLTLLLIYTPIFGLSVGLIKWLISGLILILTIVIIKWLIGGRIDNIQTVETIQINFFKNRKKLINILIVLLIRGFIFALIFGVIFGVIFGLIRGFIYGLTMGLFIVLLTMPIIVLIKGLSGAELNIKTYPNQGIQESIKNGLTISLINAVLINCIFVPIIQFIILPIANKYKVGEFINFLYYMMLYMIACSVIWTILPVLKHLSLRITIYFKNYAPWNYAKFLDYVTDKLFLQRVGGGYRFIHRMLQEYFAQMYSKR
ncbi:MAG: NACHT domain-containing protein [Crocosphaera sp.]